LPNVSGRRKKSSGALTNWGPQTKNLKPFRTRSPTTFEVAIPEAFPHVMAHPTTLVQVVTNLLTNAVKFVGSGVRPHVRVWAEERDEWGRLWVEDNGIGIAPEHHGSHLPRL